MKEVLLQLLDNKPLSKQQAKDTLYKITSNDCNEAQIAAFMTIYLMRPITEAELIGFRETLQELCSRVDLSDFEAIDLCGTGGDGKNTFNISTLSSFVVAGAGYKVAKHGNYGVSSASGSSNVLEHFGYKFTNDLDKIRQQIDKTNLCFLHAPLFHPALKSVAPIRKQLGMKTFFNILGPLVNPSFPQYQLVGVYNMQIANLYKAVFEAHLQPKNFSIVHSTDGYDEVSLTSSFHLLTNKRNSLIQPAQIGKTQLKQEELFGGNSVVEAANIFINILEGKGTKAQNDVVSVNTGLAIQCFNPQKSIEECALWAEEALISGKALEKFKQLMEM